MKNLNAHELEIFIKKQLSELIDVDINKINNDANLIDSGATSMIIVQLYLSLQEEYRIHLENELDLYQDYISVNTIIKSIEGMV